jgi:hypothetical protein
MRWQTPKIRFSLRVLMLLMALATLPAWWVAHQRSEYLAEQRALERIKKQVPELAWDQNYYGPHWLGRLGYLPRWFYRVDVIDVTGMVKGPNSGWNQSKPYRYPFNDDDFAAIQKDLRQFKRLRSLYLLMTKTTDRSLPALYEYEQLRFVNLQETAMTSREVKKLEQARPNLKVAFWHQYQYDLQGNFLPPPAANTGQN